MVDKTMETAAPLLSVDYKTINYVTGPLIFVENVHGVSYGEMVEIVSPDGRKDEKWTSS